MSYFGARVEPVEAKLGEKRGRLPSHPPLVQQSQAVARLTAEHEVLGDRKVRHERELLEDRHDPGVDRPGRVTVRRGLAVPGDRAGVRLLHAAQHLDHRALARAVLAKQGVDLARLACEIGVVERDHAAESLGDSCCRKDGHLARLPVLAPTP